MEIFSSEDDIVPHIKHVTLSNIDDPLINCFQGKFNVMFLNIRSMKLNFDNLFAYLNNKLNMIHILILGEVNIKTHEIASFYINGFAVFSSLRESKRGGGLIVYVRNEIDFVLGDVNFKYFEGVRGILKFNDYKAHLFAIYRPPENGKIMHFIDEIDILLKSVCETEQIFVVGDINIDVNKSELLNVQRYNNVMADHGMRRCVYSDTRVEERLGVFSSSCIDHFYIRANNKQHAIYSAVLETKISDHYIILVGIQNNTNIDNQTGKSLKRILNENKVKSGLKLVDWNAFLDKHVDPCSLYNDIKGKFHEVYDKAEEIKMISKLEPQYKRNAKPWITSEIKKTIKERDMYFKKWKSSKSNINYRNMYKSLRNIINKKLTKAKLQYYKNRFNNCKSDVRETWREINFVVGKLPKPSVDDVINKHMGSILKPSEIVNSFVEVFSSGVESIKHDCKIETTFKNQNTANQSMYFIKATAASIYKIIIESNINKGPGIDRIRFKDLNYVSNKISPVIAQLINLIYINHKIPSIIKQSIVKPIHKNGDYKCFENYRPIAILSSIDKIMERFMADQLVNYLNKFNIISEKQYGFQKNKSTSILLHDFSDCIFNALNKNLSVTVLFIDFSKAFDTLLHDRLLLALKRIGISGPLLAWFQDYLSNRSMTVKLENTYSKFIPITSGVPQGSILGPLLYLIYVNDMLNEVKKCSVYLYADDTALVAVHKHFSIANDYLQYDFNNILCWSHDNGLTINYKKTKAMHIHSPFKSLENVNLLYHDHACLHRNFRRDSIPLIGNCNCTVKITNTHNQTYLGLLIDNQFKWDKHIDLLCNRLRSGLYSLRILKPFVNYETLIIVYHALIESLIRYGILSWGYTTNNYLDKIENIQKRIFKLISSKSNIKVVNCNLLTIRQLHFFIFIISYYFKQEHKKSSEHTHKTRHKDKLLEPISINSYGSQEKRVLIPKLFNKITPDLLSLEKISIAKIKLKKWILSNYSPSIE